MSAKPWTFLSASAFILTSQIVIGSFAQEPAPRKPPKLDLPKDTRRLSLIDDVPVDRKKPESSARFVIHVAGDRIILLDSTTGDTWLLTPSKDGSPEQWKPIMRKPAAEEKVDPFGELDERDRKEFVRDLIKDMRKQIEMLIQAIGFDECSPIQHLTRSETTLALEALRGRFGARKIRMRLGLRVGHRV